MIRNRHLDGIVLGQVLRVGTRPCQYEMTTTTDSDYDPSHLALYGVAAVVLLVFALTYVR